MGKCARIDSHIFGGHPGVNNGFLSEVVLMSHVQLVNIAGPGLTATSLAPSEFFLA